MPSRNDSKNDEKKIHRFRERYYFNLHDPLGPDGGGHLGPLCLPLPMPSELCRMVNDLYLAGKSLAMLIVALD